MNIYKPDEFARILGVSKTTLKDWQRTGKLMPNKTMTGRNYYTDVELAIALNESLEAKKRRLESSKRTKKFLKEKWDNERKKEI